MKLKKLVLFTNSLDNVEKIFFEKLKIYASDKKRDYISFDIAGFELLFKKRMNDLECSYKIILSLENGIDETLVFDNSYFEVKSGEPSVKLFTDGELKEGFEDKYSEIVNEGQINAEDIDIIFDNDSPSTPFNVLLKNNDNEINLIYANNKMILV